MARFSTFKNGKKVNPIIEEDCVRFDLYHAPPGVDGINFTFEPRRTIVTFVENSRTIGILKADVEPWNSSFRVYLIAVDIRHRRRGIATAMWEAITGVCDVRHSREVTDLGQLWIDSLSKCEV